MIAASAATTARRAANLVEKFILGAISGAAAAVGIIEIVLTAIRVTDLLTNDRVTLTGAYLATPLDAAFTTDSVVAASTSHVDVVVEGLAVGDRAYLVAAAALSATLAIGICAVVLWLCLRVFLGRPFGHAATWGIGIISILVVAAGLGVPTLTATGYAEAALVLGIDELSPLTVEIDLAPLGWGIALAVVAAAFEIGQRLQRDTEGLV